jgi:hypothetical protein
MAIISTTEKGTDRSTYEVNKINGYRFVLEIKSQGRDKTEIPCELKDDALHYTHGVGGGVMKKITAK